jgi:hypothetical protein
MSQENPSAFMSRLLEMISELVFVDFYVGDMIIFSKMDKLGARNEKQFIMYTDYSCNALYVVLALRNEIGENVISYFSRSLEGAELNYNTTDKSFLSVIYGIEKAIPYIWGAKLTVVSDYKVPGWLMNINDNSSKSGKRKKCKQKVEDEYVHKNRELKEQFLDRRAWRKDYEYFVKWKNYSENFNCWEIYIEVLKYIFGASSFLILIKQ